FSRRDAEAMPKFGRLMARMAKFIAPTLTMTPPDVGSLNPSELRKLLVLNKQVQTLTEDELYTFARLMTMSAADYLDEWFEADVPQDDREVRPSRGFRAGHRELQDRGIIRQSEPRPQGGTELFVPPRQWSPSPGRHLDRTERGLHRKSVRRCEVRRLLAPTLCRHVRPVDARSNLGAAGQTPHVVFHPICPVRSEARRVGKQRGSGRC